ncbi:MAG: hypothetical protein AAF146_22905, partial [Bacteroidota bacterium]
MVCQASSRESHSEASVTGLRLLGRGDKRRRSALLSQSLSAKIQPAAPQERVETQTVFIVSDGKDEPLQSELITWLRQMEHNREVELWYRLKFEVGTEDSDILDKIRESEVVLLLLSPDFLA